MHFFQCIWVGRALCVVRSSVVEECENTFNQHRYRLWNELQWTKCGKYGRLTDFHRGLHEVQIEKKIKDKNIVRKHSVNNQLEAKKDEWSLNYEHVKDNKKEENMLNNVKHSDNTKQEDAQFVVAIDITSQLRKHCWNDRKIMLR